MKYHLIYSLSTLIHILLSIQTPLSSELDSLEKFCVNSDFHWFSYNNIFLVLEMVGKIILLSLNEKSPEARKIYMTFRSFYFNLAPYHERLSNTELNDVWIDNWICNYRVSKG
jgi:hypothetical protein